MSTLLLALVLAIVPQAKAPEGAGSVWLNCSAPRPTSARPALLLAAAQADSPIPLQARSWGGDEDSETIDVRAELGPPEVAVLARVRSARRVLLGPGDLRQWRATLWDGPRPSALARALRDAWSGGAEVVALGAGALHLGASYLDVDEDVLARNPRARATVARAGLGLIPEVTLDGAARAGDLRPLVEHLVARETQVALWLPAAGGARYEPGSGRWTGFGDAAPLAFDARAARHTGGRVEGLLVEWLDSGRAGLSEDPRRLKERAGEVDVDARVVPDAWALAEWREAPGPGQGRSWRAPGAFVRLVGRPAREGRAPSAWLTLELEP